MIKFFKSLPFHFRSSFKGLRRHMAMTISAASAVTVTLILMAVFLVLAGNITSFTTHIEEDFKIHASIDMVASDEEIQQLQANIEQMEGIASVTFSSKDQELEEMISKRAGIFEMYRGDANPIPNAFIIEVTRAQDVPALKEKLEAIEGIEKAQYGGETINDMIQAFTSIRNGGAVFVIGLGALAIFLISNTIKMTIYARNDEIAIMRNVGAANWFIKTPFVLEGMFIGFFGAAIPALLTLIGYGALYDALDGYFFSNMFVMQPMSPFVYYICGILLVSGVIVGIIGSFLAVSKYLRWKR